MRPMIHLLVFTGACFCATAGCERQPQTAAAASPCCTTDTQNTATAQSTTPSKLPDFLHPQAGEFTQILPPKRPPRTIEVKSAAVTQGPTIDGQVDEVWAAAPVVTTLDKTSQREIQLKSVHTEDEIFFLASYPDGAPSETHKSWVWDSSEQIYKQGPDREDALVLEWSMVGNDVNLSTYDHPQPHRADVWFWKAARTNPAGFADDKMHILGKTKNKESQEVPTADGTTLYLQRLGDEGLSCYEETMLYEYKGDVVSQFALREPQGSRADVHAKGAWADGRWTIELGRKLDTGRPDDLTLRSGETYLLGVSCYETTYDKVYPEWTQPLFRTGDVYDRLMVILAE